MMSSLWQRSFLLLLITSFVGACTGAHPAGNAGGDGLSGTITVSGAWALYPLMVRWAEVFQAEHPQVTVDVSAGGAGKGMADALAGVADLGMLSREIYPQEVGKGALAYPVAKDAVFVTVNQSNPVLAQLLEMGLTEEILAKIYISGEITTWGQVVGETDFQEPIHVYTRSDAAGAPATFAQFLGYAQEDLLGIGVYGDPGLVAAVADDPLGIGYNNLNYAFDPESGDSIPGIRVLPLDGDASRVIELEEQCATKEQAVQAVASGAYPSPPARDLYLVTGMQPTGVVREFLLWILTDGQVYVGEVGYIPVAPEKLQEAIQMLADPG